MGLASVYFYVCAALALVGALGVVVAGNPIRGAMGLLLLILSVAGLFLALHAQFLAAIQLIVYAGAIVVLFLFVIMLLGPSAAPPADRRGIFVRACGGGIFAVFGVAAIVAVVRASAAASVNRAAIPLPPADPSFGSIDAVGSVLFSNALTPFELSSALLMVAVIGAVAVARGRQGAKTLSKAELQAAFLPTPPLSSELSGVFRHDIDAAQGPEGDRTGDRPPPARAAGDASS
jgi:NADH-quinone oxidoreductase subunit J